MKRMVFVGSCAVVIGLWALASVGRAEKGDDKGKGAPSSHQGGAPDADQMMAMWAKMNQLGEPHARFKEDVGKWKTETKMWMGPGEPTVSYGVCEVSLVFGGRYLKEHYRCTSEEMPFEGMALVGYDNLKKKYVTIWLDSMSTGIMMTEGTRDDATKTATMFSAEYDDPFKGRGRMKNVIRELSKDKRVFEMHWIGADGKEFKEMEMTYTRV